MTNTLPPSLIPPNDAERLKDLRAYNLLYTEAEETFDNLTQIMAQVFGVPMVFMSLVDEDTVFYKSQVGNFGRDRADRRDSLCSVSILNAQPTVYEDTWLESSLTDNPLVKGENGIRFYAGAPLTTAKGNRIGSVCVVDTIPRTFSTEQRTLLNRFAKLVMHEMDVRLAARELAKSREAQKKLIKLVENSADVMAVLELDGTYSYLNPAGQQLLGFGNPHEVQDTLVSASHTAEDHVFVKGHIRPIVMQQGRWAGPLNVRHLKTREIIPVHSQLVRIDDPDTGLPLAFGAVMRDMRTELAAQRALRKSEQQARTMIDQSPMAIGLLKGRNMVVELGNERLFAMWGKDASIIGLPLLEALPEISEQEFMGLLQRVYDTGEPFFGNGILAKLVRNGRPEEAYFDFTYTPLREEDGVTSAVMVMATDITEKVLVKRQLEASEARFRQAVEQAPVAILLVKGEDMVLETANPLMLALMNRSADSLGKPLETVLPELNGQALLALCRQVYHTGEPYFGWHQPVQLLRDGQLQTTYFNVAYTPFYEGLRITGVLQVVTEVTDQVLAHQQLELSEERYRQLSIDLEEQVQARTQELAASNEELAATNRELISSYEEVATTNNQLNELNGLLTRSNENLEQFASIASHDLQEPLRKIQAFGDLLQNQYGPQLGEGTDYIQRMQSAAARMSRLTQDLLTFSRISTRQDSYELTSLNEVIDLVLTDLEMQINETGAVIDVGFLPTVRGDARQLGQLYQNLISNALKFRQSDITPVIHIRSARLATSALPESLKPMRVAQSYHRIDVSDNGIGFEQQYANRIFQVFQRLHGKSQYPGTGIGLAISEKVVANHGGAIMASSQPGQGATFSVYLPI